MEEDSQHIPRISQALPESEILHSSFNDSDRGVISSSQDQRIAYPPEIEEIIVSMSRYNDYDFNLFELARISGNRSLYLLSHHLFAEAKLFELFAIPIDKFSNCIAAIEAGYHSDLPCKTNFNFRSQLNPRDRCFTLYPHTSKLCKNQGHLVRHRTISNLLCSYYSRPRSSRTNE